MMLRASAWRDSSRASLQGGYSARRELACPTQTDHDEPPSDAAAARFMRSTLSVESIKMSASSMASAVVRHWRAASSSFAFSVVSSACLAVVIWRGRVRRVTRGAVTGKEPLDRRPCTEAQKSAKRSWTFFVASAYRGFVQSAATSRPGGVMAQGRHNHTELRIVTIVGVSNNQTRRLKTERRLFFVIGVHDRDRQRQDNFHSFCARPWYSRMSPSCY